MELPNDMVSIEGDSRSVEVEGHKPIPGVQMAGGCHRVIGPVETLP
jgi:hypothetical protein